MTNHDATERRFASLGAASAFLAVAAGAFGAHALKSRIAPELLGVFETAARYQMYHALGLFGVAWAHSRWPSVTIRLAGWLFVLGTVIFSGSLYALALTGITWFGALTPLGGVCFLVGWGVLAWCVARGTRGTA